MSEIPTYPPCEHGTPGDEYCYECAHPDRVEQTAEQELRAAHAVFGPEFRRTPLIECIRQLRTEAQSLMKQRDDSDRVLLETQQELDRVKRGLDGTEGTASLTVAALNEVAASRRHDNETLAHRVFKAFEEHIHVPPALESRLLGRIREEIERKEQPEWCAHCPFPKHLHYDPDGTLVAPGCIGFVPKGASRCDKRSSEGDRCSLVAGHDGHHEVHVPRDPDAPPRPPYAASAR